MNMRTTQEIGLAFKYYFLAKINDQKVRRGILHKQKQIRTVAHVATQCEQEYDRVDDAIKQLDIEGIINGMRHTEFEIVEDAKVCKHIKKNYKKVESSTTWYRKLSEYDFNLDNLKIDDFDATAYTFITLFKNYTEQTKYILPKESFNIEQDDEGNIIFYVNFYLKGDYTINLS
jgi:hypothetical protein